MALALKPLEQSTNLDAVAPLDDGAAASIASLAERRGLGDPFVAGCRDAILPMAISDPSLPDNPIVYVNPAFEALTGYARQEVLGRNCRFLQGPLTDGAELARLRGAIAMRTKVSVDLLNYRKDGSAQALYSFHRFSAAAVCSGSGGKGRLSHFHKQTLAERVFRLALLAHAGKQFVELLQLLGQSECRAL